MVNLMEDPEQAVLRMTKAQIEKALELAAAANYDRKTDPAFVGAVLMALAMNSQTAVQASPRPH